MQARYKGAASCHGPAATVANRSTMYQRARNR